MRPIFALVLVVGILGGMRAYMGLRPQVQRANVTPVETLAQGQFVVELLTTFAAGPDEFALDASDAPALLVNFRGRVLLSRKEPLRAGETVKIESVQGLAAGANEFYIQATPQDPSLDQPMAIRVRVLRNEMLVAEQTLWGNPGESVQGTILLRLPASATPQAASTDSASAFPPIESDSQMVTAKRSVIGSARNHPSGAPEFDMPRIDFAQVNMR